MKKLKKILLYAAIFTLLIGVVFFAAGNDIWKAHLANEDGILYLENGAFTRSIVEFTKSSSYNVYPEKPLYNTGNSYYRQKMYSRAHEFYQKAIESNIRTTEAYFNDGCALFAWGKEELDPDFCKTERTLALWKEAEESFLLAVEFSDKGSSFQEDTYTNIESVRSSIAYVEKKHRENEQLCQKKEDEKQNQNEERENSGQQDEEQEEQDDQNNDTNDDETSDKEDEEEQNREENKNAINTKQEQEKQRKQQRKIEVQTKTAELKKRKTPSYFRQTKEQQLRPAEPDTYDHEVWW